MFSYRAQGLLAALVLALSALGACGEPEFKTSLRPEGDPEVLAVLVVNENYDEAATYCKPGDDKVPGIITGGCGTFYGFECCDSCRGICPEAGTNEPAVADGSVRNAEPLDWSIRIIFDELLKADVVETLEGRDENRARVSCTDEHVTCEGHIDTTRPVTLTCGGVPVPYDGWYDPTGNAVTLPPGPSIVVYPLDLVATSAQCTVTLDPAKVIDKDGNPVPPAQRGPYTWSIAGLDIVGISPRNAATGVDPAVEIEIGFNSFIDADSVDAGEITLVDSGDNAATFTVIDDGTTLVLTPDAELTAGETYTLTLTQGATFADIRGGTMTLGADIAISFTIAAAASN
jgi:hypothetical protein